MKNTTPLNKAYKKFKAILTATVLFSFVINTLLFVGPIYMLQIYDRVLASRNETTLLMLSLVALFLLVAYGIMEFIRSRLLVSAGLQFDNVLSNSVFRRAVKAKIANPNGGAQYVISDIDKLREFMTGTGILTFFDALWVPLFLFMAFLFHPWLGIMATIGAVIIFILAFVNDYMTRNQLKDANIAAQGANHFASTVLQNAEVIRPMGMGKNLGKRWFDKHLEMLTSQASASNKAGGIMAFSKFVRMTLQSAVLGVGAYLALRQEITPGVMIAASIILGRALTPVEQSVAQWKQFVAARQAHERLRGLFNAIPDDSERTELPLPRGDISVEKLMTVAAGTRDMILNGVNFKINGGETLAVVGPSGSGKSTLLRCLVGVQHAANGAVRLDGAQLDHWDSDQLGENLGYLPQDVKLFSGTISENIARFTDGDNDDLVVNVAKLAGVHDMILNLKDGYETQVGDNGHQLSGGQRQRVGLARALFGDPKVIVLDEPNSNLDEEGEASLMEAMRQLKAKGSTVIVASHKTNLLSMCDKILVLKDGGMQAFTTPQELFKAQQAAAQKSAASQKAAPAGKPASGAVVNIQ